MSDIIWQSERAEELMEKDTSYVVEFSPDVRLPYQKWPVFRHYPTPQEAVGMAEFMLTKQNIDATRVRKVIA